MRMVPALLFLLLLAPVSAAAQVGPHAAVGRVERGAFGAGGAATCVGTIVGPRHVLTAAHCLLSPRSRLPLPVGQVRFCLPGGADCVPAVASTTGPGYRGGAGPTSAMLAKDWAVLVLEREVGVRPLPLLPKDTRVLTALVGEKVLRLALPGQPAPTPCALTNIGQDPALLLHDCPVTGGDSGAPLLVGEGEEAALIGMQVAILGFNGRPHNLAVAASAFADGVRRVLDDPAFE